MSEKTWRVDPTLRYVPEGYRHLSPQKFEEERAAMLDNLDEAPMEEGMSVFQDVQGVISFVGDTVVIHEWTSDDPEPAMDGIKLRMMTPIEVVMHSEVAWWFVETVDGKVHGKVNTDLSGDDGQLEEFEEGVKYFLLKDPYLESGTYRLRPDYR